jgi:lysyl-tRNA synthetase class 2
MESREQEVRASIAKRLEFFEKAGLNPYPSGTKADSRIAEISKKKVGSKATAAGRLVSLRSMGKSGFGNIEDATGKVQVFFAKDELSDKYDLVKNLDRGDFIEVTGELFITKTKALTIRATDVVLLSKIQTPLPEKFHGLADHEEKQRRRYLDLLSNLETRELFKKRSEFIRNIRSYLDGEDFLEVATPILQPLYGGALAEPFKTHHNALNLDLYLRIAPELYLKRLVVGGFDRVYEIASCFRNEGVSPQHLQEFYMLELYRGYTDYKGLMSFTEEFLKEVLKKTFGTLVFERDGKKLDFSKKWKEVDFGELVLKDTGIDVFKHANKKELLSAIAAKKLKLDLPKDASHAKVIDELYKTYSRPQLVGPIFLVNHPTELSPLAKQSPKDPAKVERFQLVVAGYEVVNGFSELNDPQEQKRRFLDQGKARDEGDKEAHEMDQDYIDALEYGLPPTAGLGMGIERIFALLTNQSSVRDVVLFPTMRPKN